MWMASRIGVGVVMTDYCGIRITQYLDCGNKYRNLHM